MKNLSTAQRRVLAIGLVLIILSFLFPCWKAPMAEARWIQSLEHRFIFTPPRSVGFGVDRWSMDIPRLAIQLVVIMSVTVGTMILLPPKNSS